MARQLLLQSILGHLSLLAEKHPKKAATPVARRAREYVKSNLSQRHPHPRRTAA